MKDLSLPRILSGVGIIAVGILALLGSFNLINFSELFSTYWPLLVIATGLLLLLANPRENYVWSIIFVALGTIWLLGRLDVMDINVWHLFWPLVLIGVGWSVLSQKTGLLSDKDADDSTAILGSNEIKNNSKDYKGSKITTILGGSSIDLRQATIKKEATVEVLVVMGGVELFVPDGWVIKSSVTPILGGVENKTSTPKSPKAPVLHITGTALMGGIEVRH